MVGWGIVGVLRPLLRVAFFVICISRLTDGAHLGQLRALAKSGHAMKGVLVKTSSHNSHDQFEYKLFATLLNCVQKTHAVVFTKRQLKFTLNKVNRRLSCEGFGFLTKALPRLGKCLDKALAGEHPMNAEHHGFKTMMNSELPKFLGELFRGVFDDDGMVLTDPCANSIKSLRLLLYCFYKYELPYSVEQEQVVIDRFVKTEDELRLLTPHFQALSGQLMSITHMPDRHREGDRSQLSVTRRARVLLERVFQGFDFAEIVPRHGPGAVADRHKLWDKYRWTNVCSKITELYPLDAYFFASLGHFCDRLSALKRIEQKDLAARVVLVPKDSRGPRLISCEPVANQWVQQGIMRSLVQHIETLDLTRFNVFFTDQTPNQRGALLGSEMGRYATLDLNEASDRVSLDLVRLLFPPHVVDVLEAVRSSSTELPDGRIVKLHKHAPMGSALCFPILALTVWSILTAAAPDADTSDGVLVYGDDVIVPAAFAADAIEQLESFGLKVNRDKSCTKGHFRESCGMDAFKGVPVTPLRFRTVWSSSASPDAYVSWMAYATSLYHLRYFESYDYIVSQLLAIYGELPDGGPDLGYPCLPEVPDNGKVSKHRTNRRLQKRERKVLVVETPTVQKEIDGWLMLLRYFSEKGGSCNSRPLASSVLAPVDSERIRLSKQVVKDYLNIVSAEGCYSSIRSWYLNQDVPDKGALSVSQYTPRGLSRLKLRWR